MRRAEQAKILELLQTLKEAHDTLKSQTSPDVIAELLANCQNFAVQIGEYIEALEGEGTKTVALLEKYCEVAYQAYVENDIKNHLKQMSRTITEIEKTIRHELRPNRIEVAFFPYQLSMWDALESIYLAAKDDPSCSAYVVPIPWFEKLPDGSLGKMHYDGGAYPADIPITDWQKYDVQARQPDVIFIHNPYDDSNHISSVHPLFFSERLCQYTERLCYLPYFVNSDDVPEDHCITPASIYAHKTIVESEKVRDTSIRVFKQTFGNRFGNPADKFVALGSPKFDAAISAKRTDYTLPEAWQQLIEGKQVVFLNTTIVALLVYDKAYLEKLRCTLEAFSKRDDVVLWWRPHPLSEGAYQSMRPRLLEEYQAIIAEYRREGYGIYDDTGMLHRAIAYSDAYYGDGGSVAVLFEKRGKKVCWNTIEDRQQQQLLSWNIPLIQLMIRVNGTLYAVCDSSHMYIINEKNGSLDYVGSIPANPTSGEKSRYRCAEVRGDKVWFFPHNDGQIAVYDTKAEQFELHPLALKAEYFAPVGDNARNFYHGLFYKNKVFLQPCAYHAVVAYNIDTKETEHCLDLRELFPKEKVPSLFYGCAWLNETTVLMAGLSTNEVLEFNLETYAYKTHALGRQDRWFHGIFKHGDDFFLVGLQPFIAKWNYNTGAFTYYDKFPDGFHEGIKHAWTWFVNDMKPYKNKLILPGGQTNMVLEFDFDTCAFQKLECFDALLDKTKYTGSAVYGLVTSNLIDDGHYYFVRQNETVYRYDYQSGTIDELLDVKTEFPAETVDAINNKYIDKMLIPETTDVSADTEPAGSKIYRYVKRLAGM